MTRHQQLSSGFGGQLYLQVMTNADLPENIGAYTDVSYYTLLEYSNNYQTSKQYLTKT